MVFNKYMTMSKVIFNTLGNGVRDRMSRTPLPKILHPSFYTYSIIIP